MKECGLHMPKKTIFYIKIAGLVCSKNKFLFRELKTSLDKSTDPTKVYKNLQSDKTIKFTTIFIVRQDKNLICYDIKTNNKSQI